MSAPVFGVINTRPDSEEYPVLGADFSKIGIVTTSDDASVTYFPAGEAVRFSSTDPLYTSAVALGTGLLADAIRGINDQVGPLAASADIVVVRVPTGGSEAQAIQNVVSGLSVLRDSPHTINATPRLIICPGYTHQVTESAGTVDVSVTPNGANVGDGVLTPAEPPTVSGAQNGIYVVEITGGAKSGTSAPKVGGNTGDGTCVVASVDSAAPIGAWRVICGQAATDSGYFSVVRPNGTIDGIATVGVAYNSPSGPTFTVSDGAADFIVGDEFVITVIDSVPANGGSFSVKDPFNVLVNTGTVGVAFSTQIAFTLADGAEDFHVGDKWNFAVVITDPVIEANPVVAALPDVLESMLAIAFVDAPYTSRLAAENWRETVQSERIVPIGVYVRVLENAVIVNRPAAPRLAGLAVRIDNAYNGNPFQPIANRPIYGIVGTSRNIPFSLTDGATEGQMMLEADIGVIVKGELGVDSAIADGGYVYIGTESCAQGDLWSQFHQIRGSDYLTVKMMRLAKNYLGRLVNADMVESWINSIRFMLRDHKAAGEILGYKVEFNPDLNSPEEIRLGHLTVTPRIEPGPAFRKATHQIMRYRPAVEQLVADIVARLNAA